MIELSKLDAKMAELMGYSYWDSEGDYDGKYPMFITTDALLIVYDEANNHREFSPSTKDAPAMQVVDKMHEKGWFFMLVYDGMLWVAEFRDGTKKVVAYADTRPEAICRAALLAVEAGK